jgi:hypothetical protein
MAAIGYLPSEAVLSGLGVPERDFVRYWTEAHQDQRPEREVIADELLALAEEVTGEPQRRTSTALFALTQAAFGRGDVALPDSHVERTLSALETVQRLGLAEDERAASVLDSAVRKLGYRAARVRLAGGFTR